MRIVICKDTERSFSEKAFSIYKDCMYKPTFEKYRNIMDELISDALVRIFLCETDDGIVGTLVMKKEADKAEIVGIAVSEKHRGRGIARQMLQHAIAEEALQTVFAQTDDDAVGFYRKCGFEVEEEVIEYPDGVCVRYNCELKLV